ncbi:MAG: peroxiredoxin family protein [Saprospiraceae bacterium]|nr:peroxiredoxin family protein [Saprospiraceae bacterium]
MKKYIEELTPQQPDSIIKYADILLNKTLKNNELFKIASNWIGSKYKPGQTTLMDGEAVYSHLILKYFTPQNAEWIPAPDLASTRKRAEEMRVSLLGMVGQDVFGQNKEGQTRSLYALNAPYKVVYIYNPDCEHCQEETPRLRAVYDQWKTKGLEVFSIAANAKIEKNGKLSPKISPLIGLTFGIRSLKAASTKSILLITRPNCTFWIKTIKSSLKT